MKQQHTNKRSRATGKGGDAPFLKLTRNITRAPEFYRLSGNATKLLIDIADQFNGWNNGDMSIEWDKMKCHGWVSKGTLHKAKAELIAAGWIICTRQGGKHKCSLYAVTWHPIDDCGGKIDYAATRVASNSWRQNNLEVPIRANEVPMRANSIIREAA